MKALLTCAAVIAAALTSPAPAAAEDAPDAVTRHPAVLASAVAPVRQALMVVPPASTSPRASLLNGDMAAYRDLLRLLGFDVTVIAAGTRPDLDAGVRAFTRSIKRDGDVAVFLLGSFPPIEGGLLLTPLDASSVPPPSADKAAIEGLKLGDVLRRFVDRGPKDVVVLADACMSRDGGGDCAAALAGLPTSVSAILARPASRPAGNSGPLAGVASLRQDLLPAMQVENRSFDQLYGVLEEHLRNTNVGVSGSPVLTRSFAFLPAGFFGGLPLACNKVEPDLDAEALRSRPSLEPQSESCGEAAARYGFSPYFKEKLAIVREQRAAQKAFQDCAEVTDYLAAFPGGRYRAAVETRKRECANPLPSPPRPQLGPAPDQPESELQKRAATAVADYFRRHDFQQGDSFGALARLYAPQVRVHRATVSRAEHLRTLGAWYGAFDSVKFTLVPNSLDLGGCAREDDCAVRGKYEMVRLRAGENAFEQRNGDFALRFDLRNAQVLAECGVTDRSGAQATACE